MKYKKREMFAMRLTVRAANVLIAVLESKGMISWRENSTFWTDERWPKCALLKTPSLFEIASAITPNDLRQARNCGRKTYCEILTAIGDAIYSENPYARH
jgi:hypothetical protein